jgi:FtsP/CotA-like multicopper oxidase with cupredoxin domain
VGLIVLPIALAVAAFVARGRGHAVYVPRTRVYYVAAEDVDWNYAPFGADPVMGQQLPMPWGAQTTYHKQHYVRYTNETFTTPIAAPESFGILGPMLHGVVGDTMKIVFKNSTTTSVSIHAHGVRYSPTDEGASYNPPRSGGGGDAVKPGARHTYTWFVRPEAGPLPGEPSSKVWTYHSHVHADQDIYHGLVGTIVITDPAHARADGSPDDVDQEIPLLWLVFNENGPGAEVEANLKHAINGYFFGNLPGITLHVGEHVRWYIFAFGNEVDVHSVHWHGGVVLEGRTYADVIELAPATAKVADMVADNPGTWLLHCHVADHMMAGMYGTYTVLPSSQGVLTARP